MLGGQTALHVVGHWSSASFQLMVPHMAFAVQGDAFIVTLDWHQFHQQDDACKWLGEFGAAVAYPGATPTTQALLLKGAASHWPAINLISKEWLVHHTTPTKPR